ncbi:MAG: hypothetical protein H0T53_02695 [Herpetosiphonaceae bacterium]|nr:hypothetical protein [Herpetosiphonaceae bacterium]
MNRLTHSFFSRFGFVLLVGILFTGGLPNNALATPSLTPAASLAPQAPETDYLWIAGSAFHSRDRTSAYETQNGCIYATSSGEFTTAVPIPDGATLETLELFLNDTSTNPTSGTLTLWDTNGFNFSRKLATAAISTSAGYASVSVPIVHPTANDTPYTVNMVERGLFMEWEPKVFNSGVQLCGARITYTLSEPALSPGYQFIAGSSFSTRDSDTDYGYSGGGCTQLKNSGRYLTADVNLPEGAEVFSLKTFFNDTVTENVTVRLIEYDGQGISRTLALVASFNSTMSEEASLTVSPYIVNESNRSLVLQADFGGYVGSGLKFCGARLEYTPPTTARTGAQTRFIAGTTFRPNKWSVDYVADEAGCIATGDTTDLEDFTALVDVPDGATITQIKHFYRNANNGPTNLRLFAVAPNGAKTQLAGTTLSVAGTGVLGATLAPKYVVDKTQRALVLEWNQGSASLNRYFCGAQVTYSFTNYVYMPLILK